ncbi:Methyltransferase [Apiospora rasikravindrae]|uniref:Methyltransferase n=1 Tax=Apiospora rasikravindrae TaxID=990691 RepID=A0ABR1SD31_9PEZI
MLVPLQDESKPWMAKGETQTGDHDRQAKDDPSKAVEWYQPTVKSLPLSTVEFFENYIGVKGENAIKQHIYMIRDMAWEVLPYPCIGLFRFLDFSIHLSPDYPRVVKRVQEGATLLDLGCCFGQDLRKLAYDAGPGSPTCNLIGTDLQPAFLQLGYELFADRDRFEATFVSGDVFAEDFLAEYRGKVDIVYLGSFLHLFSEPQQRVVVRQLRRLLRPRAGSMVFGRNLGAGKGGPFRMESIGWDLHPTRKGGINSGRVDGEHDVKWEVTSSLGRYGSANWDDDRRGWQGDETKQMMFTAIQL